MVHGTGMKPRAKMITKATVKMSVRYDNDSFDLMITIVHDFWHIITIVTGCLTHTHHTLVAVSVDVIRPGDQFESKQIIERLNSKITQFDTANIEIQELWL